MRTVSHLKYFVLFCTLLAVVNACVSSNELPPVDVLAKHNSAPEFDDNVGSYIAASSDEKTILRIIAEKLKIGFNNFDLKLLESALSPEFELRYFANSKSIKISSREDFISARSAWRMKTNESSALNYAIFDIKEGISNGELIVSSFSTYNTKYFSPRFIEHLLFKKMDGVWLLHRQSLVPLHPNNSRQYGVQIFVTPPSPAFTDELCVVQLSKGPDWIINEAVERGNLNAVVGDQTEHSVIFAFREPPRPGVYVQIEHSYSAPWASEIQLDTMDYWVEESYPYFVIEIKSSADGSSGSITYRVKVDDEVVAERRVGVN